MENKFMPPQIWKDKDLEDFIEVIKKRKWHLVEKTSGESLRCEDGKCPIIAYYEEKKGEKLETRDNLRPFYYGAMAELDPYLVRHIVHVADNMDYFHNEKSPLRKLITPSKSE